MARQIILLVAAMTIAEKGDLPVLAQGTNVAGLATLTPGRTAAENALWIENPLGARFNNAKRVVVADIKGPAVITMIHFAMPQSHFMKPPVILNRDLLIRMYWDGESEPSVECPMVDFFCDPAGTREPIDTALVNKRRGWNAYFPMPFRKSGRIELVYDGPVDPGEKLWQIMPCYSYVMYRTAGQIGDDQGYFHAHWRQESLLLGQRDYVALETAGKGKFVGWNVTVRKLGKGGYPVDENEKFYIDGEETTSIEFQGLEDSFGFSWGFPSSESMFPLTGFFPFLGSGAMAYRFFVNDAISFEKSLRVTIGFGRNEDPSFHKQFSKPGNELQLSSTAYWYQSGVGVRMPPMPPAAQRAPAPEKPVAEKLPSADELRKQGVRLHMLCGRPEKEVVFAEPGYGAAVLKGYSWDGWDPPVYHCRANDEPKGQVQVEVTVPKGAAGVLRLYIIDPDNFMGGRKETITVAGSSLGLFEDFQDGRWIEHRIEADRTGEGRILIQAANVREDSNAVISIVQWVEKK